MRNLLKFSFFILCCCNISCFASTDTHLQLTHNEENPSAKKLQHWYRHQCWKAIDQYYQSHKTEMKPEEYSACAPIVAQSYFAQGNYDAAEALALKFIESNDLNSQATPSQICAMHAIALKTAVQRQDWKAAEPHYRFLLKANTLSTLPLWVRYTLADTALEYKDPKRAIALLTPCYDNTNKDDPYHPRIAFLLGISYMRLNAPEQAYTFFLESRNHPLSGQLAGVAAKGRVQATQDIIKTANKDQKKELEKRLLSDLQALLDDHTTLNENEKTAALRQQAQLLAQMLRYDEAVSRLNQVLDISASPAERAQAHLQLAFNAYISKRDIRNFHSNAQQSLKLDPSLATLKSLRLALFHIYDKLAEQDQGWSPTAAEHLAAAYPAIGTSFAQPHQKSANRLIDNLMNTVKERPSYQLFLINLPSEEKNNALLAAHLYASSGELEQSIYLYASLADIPHLEELEPLVTNTDLKDRLNAILAYLYTRTNDYSKGCAKGSLAFASQDKISAALATLAYAASGWRLLASQNTSSPDEYLPMLELLAQLKDNKNPATEPWHVEASLEYALASAHLLKNDPKSFQQTALLIDRSYAKYFDHNLPEGRTYWEAVKKNPVLQKLLEHYAALFNAKSATFHARAAQQAGRMDEVLEWQRLSNEFTKAALGNGDNITLFIQNEASFKK